jgi:hypothetical protein
MTFRSGRSRWSSPLARTFEKNIGQVADCDANIEKITNKKTRLSAYMFAKGGMTGQRGTDADTSFALAISEGETQAKKLF